MGEQGVYGSGYSTFCKAAKRQHYWLMIFIPQNPREFRATPYAEFRTYRFQNKSNQEKKLTIYLLVCAATFGEQCK